MLGGTETRLVTALRDIEKSVDTTASILDFTADRRELDGAVFDFITLKNKFDAVFTKLVTTAEAGASTADPASVRCRRMSPPSRAPTRR